VQSFPEIPVQNNLNRLNTAIQDESVNHVGETIGPVADHLGAQFRANCHAENPRLLVV
jgi:hypothetical protein